jgi:hypothetical protein
MRSILFCRSAWVCAGLVGAGTLSATPALAAYSPPNLSASYSTIAAPGFPDFVGGVSGSAQLVQNSHGQVTGLEISATQSGNGNFFLSPTQSYAISNETYHFSAFLSLSGQISGNVSITGKISPTQSTDLYTAKIDAVDFSPVFGLGFETTDAGGWASKYQFSKESIWLYDFSDLSLTGFSLDGLQRVGQDGDDRDGGHGHHHGFHSANRLLNEWISVLERNGKDAKLNFDAMQITTVPLPAAVWFLLTGLGGLATRLRRRTEA